MQNTITNKRHEEIIDILKKIPYVTVKYLAQELHISASSIRRDLAELESCGVVIRSYGGVSLRISDNRDIPFIMRMEACKSKKRQIAAKAAELVRDGDTVFIDSSSTCMYLVYELAKKRGITIITNGVNTVHYLQNFSVKVVCTGGVLDSDDRASMVGNETIRRIQNMRANIVFFAPQAIDNDGNLFDCYPEVIAAIQQMIECSEKKVCLCDSSKIGKLSNFKMTDMTKIDVMVCDISQKEKYGKAFPNVEFI